MWTHVYFAEKLRELEEERLVRFPDAELAKLNSQSPPVFGRWTAAAGRSMQRFGEELELWAAPASEREVLMRLAARHLDRDTMIRAYGWDPKRDDPPRERP